MGTLERVSTNPPWVIECQDCHALLAKGVGPTPAAIPCPKCGSHSNLVRARFESQLGFDARLVAHGRKEHGGQVGEAVRVAGPGERDARGDVLSDTSATQEISGPVPHGEEGARETCVLLVAKLRELGEIWDQPTEIENRDSDVDCRSEGPGGILDIQVVRAANSETWKTLHRAGRASLIKSPGEFADALLEVIRKKARLPAAQLGNLVLAIDARDTPTFAMAGIIDSFRKRHLDHAGRFGFKAVWVVGPVIDLVARLDA